MQQRVTGIMTRFCITCEKGIMDGVEETTFAPEQTVTREMFVTILHRVAGEPAAAKGASFLDVPPMPERPCPGPAVRGLLPVIGR